MKAFLLSLISLVLIGGCHIFDPLNYDKEKGTPDGTIEERHAWGNEHLGISYQQVISWLENAEIVKENIGDVVAVAPVGKPNFISSYFLDGLEGNFTLEVIGSKGSAIFLASHTASCFIDVTCFERGILTVDGREIAVHPSGMSQEEFEKPENKITSLSEKIKFYNRKYPESKNDSFKSNPYFFRLWIERAEAYAELKQYQKAVSDIEVGISLFEQRNPSLDGYAASDLERYITLAALYHYFLEDYSQSVKAIRRAIVAKDIDVAYRNKDVVAVNANKHIDYLDLLLWTVRMKQGRQELGDKELRQVLKEVSKNEVTCKLNVKVSRFLLGDISERELFHNADSNPYKITQHCNGAGSSIQVYLNYYAAQKSILDGNIGKGKKMLELSLEDGRKYDRERAIALYELNK